MNENNEELDSRTVSVIVGMIITLATAGIASLGAFVSIIVIYVL